MLQSEFWAQKLLKCCDLWTQKLQEFCNLLNPTSGPRNCQNAAISGPRNCKNPAISGPINCSYAAIWFLGPEIAEMLQFLGPEIAVMLERSFMPLSVIDPDIKGILKLKLQVFMIQFGVNWNNLRKTIRNCEYFLYTGLVLLVIN